MNFSEFLKKEALSFKDIVNFDKEIQIPIFDFKLACWCYCLYGNLGNNDQLLEGKPLSDITLSKLVKYASMIRMFTAIKH